MSQCDFIASPIFGLADLAYDADRGVDMIIGLSPVICNETEDDEARAQYQEFSTRSGHADAKQQEDRRQDTVCFYSGSRIQFAIEGPINW